MRDTIMITAARSRRESVGCEPSPAHIEAAARAWMIFQFPTHKWETASVVLKNKFREGAKIMLMAAANAPCS